MIKTRIEDDERSSTGTTNKNVQKVREMVMNNGRITTTEVADNVGI